MRSRTIELLIILVFLSPLPVLAFIEVREMPYSLAGDDGSTIFWNKSYMLIIDDVEVRVVLGPAQHSAKGGEITTLNWDPEVVSIKINENELMRRTSFAGISENDPILRIPFIGLGGLASPTNSLLGFEPADVPRATLTWVEEGGDGYLVWQAAYGYEPGETIHWLNRTFTLNATLDVVCEYRLASEYQAISQIIEVTNGGQEQYLPFPLETAFTLGANLKERGISIPDRNLSDNDYFTYPATSLPEAWYNQTTEGFELPAKMWDESQLPGMLYLEFDLPEGRDWYGLAVESELSFELLTGVGVRLVSSSGFSNLRPYITFISGDGDHAIFGFKPFELPGPYADFSPMTMAAGQTASVELLWAFPEEEEGGMSVEILEEFLKSAMTVEEFDSRRRSADDLFREANDLAAAGETEEAVERAEMASELYFQLGKLSSALSEEGRKINITIQTWITASTEAHDFFDRLGRPAMVYITLSVVALILVYAAWIFVIEPRFRSEEED